MLDNSREVRRQIFYVIGCIAAVVTVIAYLVLCINAQVPFIPEGSFIMNVLNIIKTFAPLIVVALVGIEFVADKHIVFRIIFYVMIALVVLMMFFPSTWSKFVGIVTEVSNTVKENV